MQATVTVEGFSTALRCVSELDTTSDSKTTSVLAMVTGNRTETQWSSISVHRNSALHRKENGFHNQTRIPTRLERASQRCFDSSQTRGTPMKSTFKLIQVHKKRTGFYSLSCSSPLLCHLTRICRVQLAPRTSGLSAVPDRRRLTLVHECDFRWSRSLS